MIDVRTFTTLAGIPIYKDPHCAAFYEDGRPRLFTLVRHVDPPYVLVHPDRWDEFCAALRQKIGEAG